MAQWWYSLSHRLLKVPFPQLILLSPSRMFPPSAACWPPTVLTPPSLAPSLCCHSQHFISELCFSLLYCELVKRKSLFSHLYVPASALHLTQSRYAASTHLNRWEETTWLFWNWCMAQWSTGCALMWRTLSRFFSTRKKEPGRLKKNQGHRYSFAFLCVTAPNVIHMITFSFPPSIFCQRHSAFS